MKNTKIIFSFIISGILSITLVSCMQNKGENGEGKYMVRILDSSKISELEKLINLEQFRPEKVNFRYIFIDSTGQNDPNYLPGLSKYNSLQAVLYFDSVTFSKMMAQAVLMDYAFATHKKQTFNFEFLNEQVSKELKKSDEETYHGHPDLFFGSNGGKLWILDRKILLSK
jgi:hypothetical protein